MYPLDVTVKLMNDVSRVVLITGASTGIGEYCAGFLSKKGHRVYGGSRSGKTASGATPLTLDVTDQDSVSRGIGTILTREGRLDALVNNAGFGIAGAIEDTSVEEAAEQFAVNFFGVMRMCRAALPVFRRQKTGYIVNVGSIGGLIAIPYQGLYSASKFAIEGLSESLRLEVSRFGVHVVLIEPGDHRTSFTENRRATAASRGESAYRDKFERAIQRMADDEQRGPTPERIAQLVQSVITNRNPRLRYTTGPAAQRLAVWIKRLMPYSVVEKMMQAYYMG